MSEAAFERPVTSRPQAVFARTPLLDGLVPAGEAYSVILFECLAHASANVPAVQVYDSTGLHQLRVGLRRLRSALSSFGKSQPELAALNAQAKAITNAVGAARDLDVFLAGLPGFMELGAPNGFQTLMARAERSREKAWTHAIAEIASPAFAKFQDDVAAAASAKLWVTETRSLAEAAPAYLNRHIARARKRGKNLATATAPERHALRIALKKLRYTGEFFAPAYKPKAVARFMTPLKELQDLLGALNDVAQLRAIIGRLMMEETGEASHQAELSHAAGLIIGWHQARADAVIGKTTRRWDAFQKADVFWG